MAIAKHAFGACCSSLKEALAAAEFDPLIEVGEDGILYMSIGIVGGDTDDDDPSMIDHPVFFCPFCGSKLQTPEEVDAKSSGAAGTA